MNPVFTTQKNLKPGRLHEAVDKIVRQNMGVGSEEARIVPLALPQTQEKIYLVFVEPKNVDKAAPLKPSRIKPIPGKKSESVENVRLREELLAPARIATDKHRTAGSDQRRIAGCQ